MAAPSKSFTVIPDGDIDPDSPLTTGLFTSLRDNDIHLEEWLGLSFVAAQDHDHDGVNSKAVATPAASGVATSTAGFNRILSGADTDVQKALDTLDNSGNGLFGSALFNLAVSGTSTVGTGALSFTPKVVIVVGLLDATSSSEDSVYVGFATGTGTLARSLAHRTGSGTGFSVDADSIGGRASATAGATSHLSDLDVITFSKAGGIVFTPSSSTGLWTFKVLVFGFAL